MRALYWHCLVIVNPIDRTFAEEFCKIWSRYAEIHVVMKGSRVIQEQQAKERRACQARLLKAPTDKDSQGDSKPFIKF